jgi:hypothetical protein
MRIELLTSEEVGIAQEVLRQVIVSRYVQLADWDPRVWMLIMRLVEHRASCRERRMRGTTGDRKMSDMFGIGE